MAQGTERKAKDTMNERQREITKADTISLIFAPFSDSASGFGELCGAHITMGKFFIR